MSYSLLPEDKLLRAGITIVETIIRWGNLPGRALERQLAVAKLDHKDPNNVARALDSTAHNYAVLTLKAKFGDDLYIYGEEARTPRSLSRYRVTVAIFDAVDGTDLVARGFSNWCSALVFFAPRQKEVRAAVVGHGSGEIYYASSRGAFKKARGRVRPLKRNADEQLDLAHSSVCFYGQKPSYFLANSDRLLRTLKDFAVRISRKEMLNFRLYNFGGNPMMVKVPDRTVDAVFDTLGQRAHDVVPGAYIATQAGAVFTNLQGNSIDLAGALLNPQEKLTYILAATHSLAEELRATLAPTAC